MKTHKRLHLTSFLVALSIMLVSAFDASAQRGQGGGRGFGGSQEMIDALTAINEATADLQTQKAEAMTALMDVVYAETVNETEIAAKAAAVAKIDAAIALAQAKAFATVRAGLSEEDITAMKAAGARGGRGFGRGGRGGFGGGAGRGQ